ncbi:MAG: sodium/glutamate symporter [Synergistes sp.]|nr:sodium/glutamate symporter [Synergistes sp.]
MELTVIKLNFVGTLAFASVLYWLGIVCVRKINFLKHYNIPPAVVGGILFAVLRLFISGKVDFDFDLVLMDPFMTAFFASVGLAASVKMLKAGGSIALKLFVAAVLLLIIQNGAALLIGQAFGLNKFIALLAGSPTMTGGHGTGILFAHAFTQDYNMIGAMETAVACATFGVIAASLLGGPVAEFLIYRGRLASEIPAEEYRKDLIPDVMNFGDKGEEATPHTILMTIFQLTFAAAAGMKISDVLFSNWHIIVPGYAVAILIAVLIRNIADCVPFLGVHTRVLNHLSGACLSFFLAFALMSVDLSLLANMALPLAVILAIQTLIMLVFAIAVTFRMTGSDYRAAVVTAGHIGFGLGATPTAIANMEAVCAKYGVVTDAFFAVAAIGAFFIDIVNLFVINVVVRLLA